MRGDTLNARLLERIRDGLDLTVVYPDSAEVRPAPTGTSPTSAPANILTGVPQTTGFYEAVPVPVKPPVTVKCLFYPAYVTVASSVGRDKHYIDSVGWQAKADALAQVEIATAALVATDYRGDTIFTGSHHVEVNGHHYEVLSVLPMGPGHRDPVSYYVWLSGNMKQ